jgi:hypothetical protein
MTTPTAEERRVKKQREVFLERLTYPNGYYRCDDCGEKCADGTAINSMGGDNTHLWLCDSCRLALARALAPEMWKRAERLRKVAERLWQLTGDEEHHFVGRYLLDDDFADDLEPKP